MFAALAAQAVLRLLQPQAQLLAAQGQLALLAQRFAVFTLPGVVFIFNSGECLTRSFELLARCKLAWVQARKFRRELFKALAALQCTVIALRRGRALP
jgi:hypothetical protein